MNCPHCQTPIENHEASRCLDALIAEKIMGWKSSYGDSFWQMLPPEDSTGRAEGRVYSVPEFSTKIEIAWRVIEAMNNEQIQGHVGPTRLHRLKQCSGKAWGVIWCTDFGYTEEVFAPTAQLAICRAALKALSQE